MLENIESIELSRFYSNLQEEIGTLAISSETGGFREEIFTQIALDLLANGGETENPRTSFDEKTTKSGIQHKLNAHAISDNHETVDLFISIYNDAESITKVPKDEIDKAAKRVSTFFKNAYYNAHHKVIDESQDVFAFADTLGRSNDLRSSIVRVNAFIVTDGLYNGKVPSPTIISGHKIEFKIVDIQYLYNLTEKSHIPIEIDFAGDGFTIPCIKAPDDSSENESYLAIVPGMAIANIYERFGARLLEQNIRSFLQFSGKINKGIRATILNEPEMFMAFNNGISATAESILLTPLPDGTGHVLSQANDLQIVNGGQTTASIFYTWKKDKKDLSKVFVQMKLTVVHNKENFSEIVGRIAEYANTQNRVSVSDLSSNRPFHIEFEKLSRSIWAPPSESSGSQTRWFYDRARGQYKNARLKEGLTKAKQKAFDISNPRAQIITKEDLAKFVNAFSEVQQKQKIIIGPHVVVRGSQKNYAQFIANCIPKSIDNIYFEDSIAKAILFKSAEKIYGVKPNSIGDMRYITVPYTLSYFSFLAEGKLDLYKIWKSQSISRELKVLLDSTMRKIERFIKENAPGSLYGEWAKKEECWKEVKNSGIQIDFNSITKDLLNPESKNSRVKITQSETEEQLKEEELQRIRSISYDNWKVIEDWGKSSQKLPLHLQNRVWDIARKVRNHSTFSDIERVNAIKILDLVAFESPMLLYELELSEAGSLQETILTLSDIDLELVKKMVAWEKKYKRLPPQKAKFLIDVMKGDISFSKTTKMQILNSYENLKGQGFVP